MERIENLFPNYNEKEISLIFSAFQLAEKMLEGKKRENGDAFIEHPISVAKIAYSEIGLASECIIAIFLHEACRFDSALDIRKAGNFSEEILTIVEGLNKISTIAPKDTELEAEIYQKLIVSYSKDPRVTILKLADRLDIMRSLSYFNKTSIDKKTLETEHLYIPLTHKLGLYNMKSEMENICFKIRRPVEYRTITNQLKCTEKDRERLMIQFIEPLKQAIANKNIKYKLKIRTKTAYSIWKKMEKQKVSFEEVFDLFAIRFIIDCEGDIKEEHALCWDIFSLVTEKYESDTKRLRDWISKPKKNGYESLHITVKNEENVHIEIQIRTTRMDDIAENGLASHWSYKGIEREKTLDNWLNSVKQILANPNSYLDENKPEEIITEEQKEIYVYTPEGKLRTLPTGATVLDFAFNIHSNLGLNCVGATINGKAVPIREVLKTGDQVEIMKGKNQKPSADWLNFVVTSKARTRIKQKLSEFEFIKATDGKELLERRLKNWKLEFGDDILAAFMKKMQYKNVNALFAAIGGGILDVGLVKTFINDYNNKAREEVIPEKKVESDNNSNKNSSSNDIIILDAKSIKNMDYKMSKCCNPVFGDEVFGFITIKEGMKIHRMSCPNASRLIEMYPYRIRMIKWNDNPSTSSFQTGLRITAALEPSINSEIMDVVNSYKASIRQFNVTENQRNGTYEITMRISIPNNLELDKVISQLRNLRNIIRLTRT